MMMALERHAATAAHWSREQYEVALSGGGPSRVVLVVEEDTGLQGFIVGRNLGAEWEIENIVVAEADTIALRVPGFGSWAGRGSGIP